MVVHAAWSTPSREWIGAKTYALAMLLWAGAVNASQAADIARVLSAPDMLSPVGRELDERRRLALLYSNDDVIVP